MEILENFFISEGLKWSFYRQKFRDMKSKKQIRENCQKYKMCQRK